MCKCRSNAFLKEYDTTLEEINKLRERGAIIIDTNKIKR